MDFMSALRKVVSAIKEWADENKVQKIDGKGLSTHDYTAEDKNKVDGMADGLAILGDTLYLSHNGNLITDSAVTLPEYGVHDIVTLRNELESNSITADSNSNILLKFSYTSANDEIGTAYIYVGDDLKAAYKISPGEHEIDVSKHMIQGINVVRLMCMDQFGNHASLIYTIEVAWLRKHNVYFYNDNELLYVAENIPHGSSATYTGAIPTKLDVENPEEYVFTGWSPLPENVMNDTCCYASFKFTGYLFGKLGKARG